MGNSKSRRAKPQKDPVSRMLQLGNLALDEIERRVLDGSATSQELTTLAKMGSEKHQLEIEKLRRENELLKAKTEAIESGKKIEELYANAVKYMGIYRGEDNDESESEDIY